MDYFKHYIKLVRKAENRDAPLGYVERHHVFPKSIFGENKRIVKLTAREHYIAHALLEKIYITRYGMKNPITYKMTRAFFLMNNAEGRGQNRYINSKLYETNRIRFSNSVSGSNSPMYGKKRVFTEEHIANMRASRKIGKDNPLYGIPRSEEIKQKIKNSKQNISDETKSKISKAHKGVKLSDYHRQRLSESHKGNIPSTKGKSKLLFELTSPTQETQILNGIELRTFANLNKFNIKGLRIAARSTCKFKNYMITDISSLGIMQ
jgi:hypothetical protein